jgi:uncharacterized membrane protein YfcA
MLRLLVHSSEVRSRDVAAPTLGPAHAQIRASEIPAARVIALSRAILFLVFAIASTAAIGWITGSGPHPLVVLSVTAGALVAGLAGVAFSAVAGALVMHWVASIVIVPVLLACSITTQLFSIAQSSRPTPWHPVEWRRIAPFLLAGFVGIPLGAVLLRDTDPRLFAVSFGGILIIYGAVMLLEPGLVVRRGGRLADAAFGLISGITGGAIDLPGVAPAIGRRTRGLPRDVQHTVVQPFILVMQTATLAYFARLGILTSSTVASYLVCAPAVLFGTWLGRRLFNHIDDAAFRRVVLIFIIVSGVSLVL